MDAPDLSTFVAALESIRFEETLSGEGPYTVFAPTTLQTHLIEDETIMSADIEDGTTMPAMSGTELEFAVTDGTVTVNGIEVTTTDIEASNGVIHIIDGVLFPD